MLGAPLLVSLSGLVLRERATLMDFSTPRIMLLLALEVPLGGLFAWYLYRRGWRWHHVTRPFRWKDLLSALGVWVVGVLCFVAGWLFALSQNPGLLQHAAANGPRGHPAVVLVVVASIINPLFEESIWLGFAVNGPGARRPWSAVVWSVVPRFLVHLYQGWPAVFSILPLGLWFFLYYARSRRLWPVVIAHGLQDAISLGYLAWRGIA